MEIPSKLTTNMLHGRALQSMNDIDSSRFFNLQGHGNLDSHNNSYVPSCSSPRKLDGIENIASLKPTVPGVKALSETLGKINPTMSAIHTKPDSQREKLTISGSAAAPLLQRPAFQMTAPEEDLDDDDDSNSSEPFVTENDKLESKTPEYETTDSVTTEFEKPLVSSAECAAACSSVLNGDAYSKFLSMSITSKGGDFSFPMASESETSFQMTPMPTMPSSLVDFVFDTSSAPAFSFTLAGNATLANSSSPAGGVGTASPGHDQMDVEDSMADDTMQAAVPTIPVFAQEISRMADDTIQAAAPTIPVFAQANSLPASSFTFDSSTSRRISVFQFAGQPTTYVSQGGSPFQAGGCLHASSGGSFSLSTGDKSVRRVARINRNRRRRE